MTPGHCDPLCRHTSQMGWELKAMWMTEIQFCRLCQRQRKTQFSKMSMSLDASWVSSSRLCLRAFADFTYCFRCIVFLHFDRAHETQAIYQAQAPISWIINLHVLALSDFEWPLFDRWHLEVSVFRCRATAKTRSARRFPNLHAARAREE